MTIIDRSEVVTEWLEFGIRAFTTTRDVGSFGLMTNEPVRTVMSRWHELRRDLAPGGDRLATAGQVHGSTVLVHHAGWQGWLRSDAADGHISMDRGTALAVTIADCVPVFIAHPSGAVAALHSGWRGTAARIVERGIEALTHRGLSASELRVHLGPGICGKCYEVSAEVYAQLTGTNPAAQRLSICAPSSPTTRAPRASFTSRFRTHALDATTIVSSRTARVTSVANSA